MGQLNDISQTIDSYGLKAMQEKSDLEYRLKSMEAKIQGDPQLSIIQIDQRINEIRQQWNQERSYMTERFANMGILTTSGQAPEALSGIDAKYQNRINTLEQQKNYYNNMVANQEQKNREIAEIKRQIEEIDRKTDEDIQKIKTNVDNQNKQALGDFLRDVERFRPENKPTAQSAFDYIESFSLDDASGIYRKIEAVNPGLMPAVVTIYWKKYPNGKPGTSKHDEYLASLAGDKDQTQQKEYTKKNINKNNDIKKVTSKNNVDPFGSKEVYKGLFSNLSNSSTSSSSKSIGERDIESKPLESIENIPTKDSSKEIGVMSRIINRIKKLVFWK